MKRLVVILNILMLAFAAQGFAQARTVTGRVTASDTGRPLAGVTVVAQGTNVSTRTDADGRYSINAPASASNLLFNALQYGTRTVAITGSVVDVRLAPQAVAVEGVVVTALGIERQERALGVATETVSGQDLPRSEPNIVNTLSGRVAGVNITNSGPQGGSSRIVIRGENSITGENQPLWVVDGVPIDNYNLTAGINADQGGRDYGNAVQDLDPNLIESITVLKGPNAAALYGSRASNGAVIVTTRRGNGAFGTPQISVSQLATWEDELRLPEYQDQYGQGLNGRFSYYDGNGGGVFDEYDESWGPALDGRLVPQWNGPLNADGTRQPTPWVARPNNVDDFFEIGQTLNTNVSVMAANERLNGRFGVSHLAQDAMVPGQTLGRTTLSFAGGIDATERFNLSSSVQYSSQEGNNRPGVGYGEDNPMSQFIWFGRQVDVKELRRVYNERRPANDPQAGLPVSWNYAYHPNPYYLQLVNGNRDTRDRLIGQLTAGYEFNDWLSAQVRSGLDWYQDWRQKTYAEDNFGGLYTTNPLDAGREYVADTGAFGEWNIGFQEVNTDFLITAAPDLDLPFSINASFGGNRRDWERSHRYVWVGELATPGVFNEDNAAITPDPFVRRFQKRVNSLYGQAELGFNDYFFVTLTGRNDWSSTLPEKNNSFFYPSVAASLVFSDMLPALTNTGMLSYGKLRASWAQVGSDTSPYQLRDTYTAGVKFGDTPTFSLPTALSNSNLKPEITRSWEVGTELGFFENRIGLDLTYYNEETSDQIMPVSVSATTGYQSRWLNAGTVQNKGIETLLRLTPVDGRDFRWETSFTYSKNNSTVVELAEGVNGLEISLGDFWGTTLFARKGEPYGQLVGYGFLRNKEGQLVVSAVNGLPLRTATPVPIGNFNPDWRGSWRNEFRYKGVGFDFLLDTRQGGEIYSVTKAFGNYAGVLAETAGKGRCVTSGVTAETYPLCTVDNGIVVENAVQISAITNAGKDTTFVPATPRGLAGTAYYTRAFLTPEANMVDASYVKLREATLSFGLPVGVSNRLGLSGVDLSLIGRNLFLWTPESNKYIDPETGSDATNVQGFEYGQMPTPRSIGINITVRP